MIYMRERQCQSVVIALYCLKRRDRETAFVSLNYNLCWVKRNVIPANGTQLCDGLFKEELFHVTGCYVTLPVAPEATVPLTMHVWANVYGEAKSESFAIDNVVISKLEKGDYAGWVYDRRYWRMCLLFCIFTCTQIRITIYAHVLKRGHPHIKHRWHIYMRTEMTIIDTVVCHCCSKLCFRSSSYCQSNKRYAERCNCGAN